MTDAICPPFTASKPPTAHLRSLEEGQKSDGIKTDYLHTRRDGLAAEFQLTE
jgi:hypothetical protein